MSLLHTPLLQALVWSGRALRLGIAAAADAVNGLWHSAMCSVATAIHKWLPTQLHSLWNDVNAAAVKAAAVAENPQAERLLGQALWWALLLCFLWYLPDWWQVRLGLAHVLFWDTVNDPCPHRLRIEGSIYGLEHWQPIF